MKCIVLLLILCVTSKAQIWSALGTGSNAGVTYGTNIASVIGLAEYQANLILSGTFTKAGDRTAMGMAQWNGMELDSLTGNSVGTNPSSIIEHSSCLFIGGHGSSLAGVANSGIVAKWDGTKWLNAGGKPNDMGTIYCFAVYNNELYAGGQITKLSGNVVNRIARWTGTQWIDVAGGLELGFMPNVHDMKVFNGKLYVTGDFWKAGGKNIKNIATWDGVKWDSIGNGLNDLGYRMTIDSSNGYLYVAGGFTKAGNVDCPGVARWDGANWSAIDSIITDGIVDLEFYHGELYMAGGWSNNLPTDTLLARWDGLKWHPVLGPAGGIQSLGVYNDDLYVGGTFTYVNTIQANNIARWHTPGVGIPEKKSNGIVYLENNQPNPFDDKTEIKYHLPVGKKGIIKIFNGTGISVSEYNLKPGNDKIVFNAKDLPAGMYYYSMYINGELVETKKMVICRD